MGSERLVDNELMVQAGLCEDHIVRCRLYTFSGVLFNLPHQQQIVAINEAFPHLLVA